MKFPQFTLRDLFWLVLVCALAIGWWADRRSFYSQLTERYHNLKKSADQMAFFIEERGLGRVSYGERGVNVDGSPLPREPDWQSLTP